MQFKSYAAAPRYHSHAVFTVIRQVTRMNGTTLNGTAKLIGLFSGAVGGLGGIIYAVRQLCTKEDLKEAKDEIRDEIRDEITRTKEDLKEAKDEITRRIKSVETRIDNHNNNMSQRIDSVNGNIIRFMSSLVDSPSHPKQTAQNK